MEVFKRPPSSRRRASASLDPPYQVVLFRKQGKGPGAKEKAYAKSPSCDSPREAEQWARRNERSGDTVVFLRRGEAYKGYVSLKPYGKIGAHNVKGRPDLSKVPERDGPAT